MITKLPYATDKDKKYVSFKLIRKKDQRNISSEIAPKTKQSPAAKRTFKIGYNYKHYQTIFVVVFFPEIEFDHPFFFLFWLANTMAELFSRMSIEQ